MNIRQYNPTEDFEKIKTWITDERTHLLWCANWIQYPIKKENFESVLKEANEKMGEIPYVAEEDGALVGFFAFSVKEETKEGKFRFVVVDPSLRGAGHGSLMLSSAVRLFFETTDAESIILNVYTVNAMARRCYEKVGFEVEKIDEDTQAYKDEMWGRVKMRIRRKP